MILTSSLTLLCGLDAASRAQIEQSSMVINAKLAVDSVGNGRIEATMRFNPPRIYDRIKKAYPNLYVLFRDMIANDRANTEVDRAATKINADDATQTITFTTATYGAAINRNGVWQISLAKGESLVTNENSRVITSLVSTAPNGMILNGTGVYALPAGAQSVSLDKENRLLTYRLPAAPAKAQGQPQLDLAIRSQKNVMSALYKVYGDPEIANGRYWIAKAVIRNTGSAPMRDVRVTYGAGEWADPFTSEAYAVVMPKGAVVDCYYPLFKSKVSQLKTRTPMQLSVKVEYKDAVGKPHVEERTERLSLLGINQFVFSNLSEDEKTDSWFDGTNNGPLLAAYVTKIDDPVKQLAGYISEAAGGVAASDRPEDGMKWLRAAYNTELLNNIVYQTPSGEDFSQDIKYPRDVLRAKSGTCVDLAILYAALAESVGMKSYLMLVPGHCFSVFNVGGQLVPVENTGLGGGDKRMSFDQALATAQKELQQYMQQGLFYLIDVDAQQGPGRISSPELPALEANFLETCGIRRTGLIVETKPGRQPAGPAVPERGSVPGNTAPPATPAVEVAAKDFNGVWKGEINGLPFTLTLDQSGRSADGSVLMTGPWSLSGTFKKATVEESGLIKLKVRAVGGGQTYSVSLEGHRDGNTITGSGTVVMRGALDVPLDTRSATWSVHFAGTR